MPALKLFGYRTAIAGDDVSVLCLWNWSVRIVQIGLIIPLFFGGAKLKSMVSYYENSCKTDFLEKRVVVMYFLYLALSTILTILTIYLEAMIWYFSRLGTPTDPKKRRPVAVLFQFKLIVISFLRFAALVVGLVTLNIIYDYCTCDTTPDADSLSDLVEGKCTSGFGNYSILVVLVLTHLVDFCFSIALAVFIFRHALPDRPLLFSQETSIKFSCHVCCCCCTILTFGLFGGHNLSPIGGKASNRRFISDMAMTLSGFFTVTDHIDLVFSDVMAGLFVVMQRQQDQQVKLIERIKLHHCEDNPCADRLEAKEGEPIDDCLDNDFADAFDHQEDNGEGVEQVYEVNISNCCEAQNKVLDLRRGKGKTPREDGLKKGNQNSYCVLRHDSGMDPSYHVEPMFREVLSKGDNHDLSVIAEGARFVRNAFAIYTWSLHLINNPVKGPFILTATCLLDWMRWYFLCKPKNKRIKGDGLFGWHRAALLMDTPGLKEEDIVYASFNTGVDITPYAITIDNEWKSIVLSVRGTISLEELAVDLEIHPEFLELEGIDEHCGLDGHGIWCHGGILACARWLHRDLQKHKTLEKLLLDEKSKFLGYQLRLVGHSLGAGIAALLSFMLRSKFENLRCLCFSPPCVLSKNAALQCKDYLTSYVLGSDIVPRLGLESMEHLRNSILKSVSRIKVPKHKILHPSYLNGCYTRRNLEDLLYKKEDVPQTKFSDEFEKFKENQRRLKEEREMENIRLHAPGRIVHLIETGKSPSRCGALSYLFDSSGTRARNGPLLPPYTAQWTTADDFDEIILSSSVLFDHDIAGVCQALEMMAESFGLEAPYLRQME